MNEVGQASIGENDQPGDRSGNSLSVSRLGGGVRIGRVGTFVAVLGAAAAGNQLDEGGEETRFTLMSKQSTEWLIAWLQQPAPPIIDYTTAGSGISILFVLQIKGNSSPRADQLVK